MIEFVDPRDKVALQLEGERYRNPVTGATVATVRQGIPRFFEPEDNYAESFGYQWKKWHSIRSDVRNPGHGLREVILARTHFGEYDLAGKTLLESVQLGDIPGIGMVMIDGIVRCGRSRNTPPATEVPVVVGAH